MRQADISERRKHQRFQMLDYALVFNDTVLGEIVDISEGGFAFKHKADVEIPVATEVNFDIMCTVKGILIEQLPCHTVSSFNMEESSPDKQIMKKCGAKLGSLTREQAELYKHFQGTQQVSFSS